MPDMHRRPSSAQPEATADLFCIDALQETSVQVNNSANSTAAILGFDYGARRIGVAVGNGLTRSARALEVVTNGSQGPDWQRRDLLLREWRPEALLIGLPLTMDGAEQQNSRAARAFAAALGDRYGLAVHLVDERLSSHEAARRFADRRARGETRRKHAQALDAIAAEIIIETWLSATPGNDVADVPV
jgi:putative Holliday junction resolvase